MSEAGPGVLEYTVSAPVAEKAEAVNVPAADSALSSRRKELARKFKKWASFFAAGSAVAFAGFLLTPVAPLAAVTVGYAGAQLADVGFWGMVGNRIKRYSKTNT